MLHYWKVSIMAFYVEKYSYVLIFKLKQIHIFVLRERAYIYKILNIWQVVNSFCILGLSVIICLVCLWICLVLAFLHIISQLILVLTAMVWGFTVIILPPFYRWGNEGFPGITYIARYNINASPSLIPEPLLLSACNAVLNSVIPVEA